MKAEIGKLVAVLKNSESQVFESIKEELTRLESEKRELETKLRELQAKKTPLDKVTALAKTFVESWPGLGELFQIATGDERRTLLEQFVEVIQLTPASEDAKRGTYVMRLFPEAMPVRRTRNGASHDEIKRTSGGSLLTEPPLVLQEDEKAPRLGLEGSRSLF